jgi:D-serine dehydratase
MPAASGTSYGVGSAPGYVARGLKHAFHNFITCQYFGINAEQAG